MICSKGTFQGYISKARPGGEKGGVCQGASSGEFREIPYRIYFQTKKVSLEEGASLIGGTAASLVQEAVGDRQAPNDAIKQVVSFADCFTNESRLRGDTGGDQVAPGVSLRGLRKRV